MLDLAGRPEVRFSHDVANIKGLFGLRLYVPVNNFSVMSGRSHRFLGITSFFLGAKCILLKDQNGDPK